MILSTAFPVNVHRAGFSVVYNLQASYSMIGTNEPV